MSLYASRKAVESTISLFTDLQECIVCGKYFTELENVGCWDCLYHPGKYDPHLECYTCCGESHKRPAFHYRQYGHIMTWGKKDKWNHIKSISDGCCRCDCRAKKKSPIPKDTVPLEDIATLLPFMNRKIEDRPGLKKGPLRLERKESRPYVLWKKPPSNGF